MRRWLGTFLLLAFSARDALAGMPKVVLTDLSREMREYHRLGVSTPAYQRLEVISFFLLGLLACTWAIQLLWNSLRKDFPTLPRLSFARALGFIVLWGLLFVVVLTMISGARELMTPGAWVKEGVTYKLAQSTPPPIEDAIGQRVESIRRLRNRLVEIAASRDRVFPPDAESLIEDSLWRLPTPPGGRYVYVGGGRLPEDSSTEASSTAPRMWEPERPMVYEPESVGPDRLVLTNRLILKWLPAVELERELSEGAP